MVSSAHLQGTSLIMYLIGQYQGKVQIVTDCRYVRFFFVLKILIVQCLKGSSSAAVKLLPCGHEVMNSWKQPLAEMQGKAMYIRPKVAGPLLRPCASGSCVYRAACFILIVHCFTFLNMYIFTAS
jgi:hypothetical protein